MDYYNLAERNYKSALDLYKTENYMSSVYFCCLTIELFLKSKLMFVEYNSDLEVSHDIINLYYAISSKYKPSKDLIKGIRFCRKYFNESRYPSFANIDEIYTKEFAEQFLGYVKDIKEYIDNDCQASLNDLEKKFTKVRKLDSFGDK